MFPGADLALQREALACRSVGSVFIYRTTVSTCDDDTSICFFGLCDAMIMDAKIG